MSVSSITHKNWIKMCHLLNDELKKSQPYFLEKAWRKLFRQVITTHPKFSYKFKTYVKQKYVTHTADEKSAVM